MVLVQVEILECLFVIVLGEGHPQLFDAVLGSPSHLLLLAGQVTQQLLEHVVGCDLAIINLFEEVIYFADGGLLGIGQNAVDECFHLGVVEDSVVVEIKLVGDLVYVDILLL